MKEIKLNKGFTAQVDDEDFKYLNQFKWYYQKTKKGPAYAHRYDRKGKCQYSHLSMHREIMKPPINMVIDHIDHNGLNNQKSNLRICTHSQNLRNRHRQRSSQKYIGVRRRIENGRYSASIYMDGKNICLGCFDTPEEAAVIRDKAVRRYFDEFALLNFKL